MKTLKNFAEYTTSQHKNILEDEVGLKTPQAVEEVTDDVQDDVQDEEEPEITETDAAAEYVSNKIAKLKNEGYEEDQASAIAFSMAKKRGFKIS
jgi:hypothetical protein